MKRRLPITLDVREPESFRHEPDDDGRGYCRAGRRCPFRNERQALHQHGFCAACCVRVCFPGECENCEWFDAATGEPYDDEDDDD